jgi:hypothetical protein
VESREVPGAFLPMSLVWHATPEMPLTYGHECDATSGLFEAPLDLGEPQFPGSLLPPLRCRDRPRLRVNLLRLPTSTEPGNTGPDIHHRQHHSVVRRGHRFESHSCSELVVGVGLIPAAASCSKLGQTVVYEVDTPSTGKFQVENVTWNGTSLPGSGYLPGRPAHLPYGNLSVCDSLIDLLVTLSYIPPGPANETLSLTVDWAYATIILP